MNSEKCTCTTCGYQWTRGQDGSHSCTPYLLKTIERLSAEPVSLAVGDVVKLYGMVDNAIVPIEPECLITDALLCDGEVQYAINGNAWYAFGEAFFVRRATEESFKAALDFTNNGEPEDDEDDGDSSEEFERAWEDSEPVSDDGTEAQPESEGPDPWAAEDDDPALDESFKLSVDRPLDDDQR